METPLTEASAHTNHVIKVYADKVEIQSGWQGQKVESFDLRDIENITLKGLVNCTLVVKTNKGRVLEFKRMALPEARRVKSAVETQKSRAGLYD
ncbi:MAG: hypothetical protein ACR2KW_10000 [Rubrobacter sp.]